MLNKVRENCLLNEPNFYHIRIRSFNNFPTACGLASSASGFACLALCLANAFKYTGDLSDLARVGSGSACRSCHGGFVKWNSSVNSSQSVATMLYAAKHWPEMNILALILEDGKKTVSSTNGMQTSVKTSQLLKHRVKMVEEESLNSLEQAVKQKDFDRLGEIAMRDSNSFHSVCMDTYPPLFYLNDKSKEIIRLVNLFNELSDVGLKAFYSFDAGPNAFLFVRDEHLQQLLYVIFLLYFQHFQSEEEFLNNSVVKAKNQILKLELDSEEKKLLNAYFTQKNCFSTNESIVKYLIHSKVGENPVVFYDDLNQSLLDEFGQPK